MLAGAVGRDGVLGRVPQSVVDDEDSSLQTAMEASLDLQGLLLRADTPLHLFYGNSGAMRLDKLLAFETLKVLGKLCTLKRACKLPEPHPPSSQAILCSTKLFHSVASMLGHHNKS